MQGNNWGWSLGPISPSSGVTYEFEIWAAAAQCDLSKGYLAGTLRVEYDGNSAIVTYETIDAGYYWQDIQFYVGQEVMARQNYNPDSAKFTAAPGQYPVVFNSVNAASITRTINFPDPVTGTPADGPVYVVAHANVCGI